MDSSLPGFSCPWDFSSKNTGVSCHRLLQRIFPTQGSTQSPTSPALAGGSFSTEPPGKPDIISHPSSIYTSTLQPHWVSLIYLVCLKPSCLTSLIQAISSTWNATLFVKFLLHESFPDCFRHIQFLILSSVQLLNHVRLFATPWTAARQASLSITNSWSLLKLKSIDSVMPSNHLILCLPFSSCLQSFPASGFFQMSQFFESGGQSIGVSPLASVLPMNAQDWSPLGWIGWISLQSKGLSRGFSNTTIQKYQFFSAQPSLYSNSHIHT